MWVITLPLDMKTSSGDDTCEVIVMSWVRSLRWSLTYFYPVGLKPNRHCRSKVQPGRKHWASTDENDFLADGKERKQNKENHHLKEGKISQKKA